MRTSRPASSGLAAALLLLLVALLALAPAALAAPAPGDTLWSRQYSSSATGDGFSDVARGPGGVVYAVGFTRATEEVSTLLLVKYSADGARLWTRTYKAPGRSGSNGTAVRVDAKGRVLVAGDIGIAPPSSTEGRDIVVLKYNTAGTRLWARTYDGPAHRDDYPTDMVLDGAGTAYVVGSSRGAGTGRDYVLLSVRTDGALRYTHRYDGPGTHDDAAGVAIDSGGNAYVTGSSEGSGGGGSAAATMKVSHSGQRLWTKRLTFGAGVAHGNDVVLRVVGDQRRLFVAGSDVGGMSTGANLFVARLQASTGTVQASTQIDSGGNDDVGSDLVVSANGDAVAAGYTTDRSTLVSHAFVAKVAFAGGELWQRQVWLDVPGNESNFQALAMDPDGNVYCGGYGERAGLGPEAIVVSVSGANVWRWINTSSGSANAVDICRAVQARGGAVYAAGLITRTTSGVDGVLKKLQP